jgi:hypothetical protein
MDNIYILKSVREDVSVGISLAGSVPLQIPVGKPLEISAETFAKYADTIDHLNKNGVITVAKKGEAVQSDVEVIVPPTLSAESVVEPPKEWTEDALLALKNTDLVPMAVSFGIDTKGLKKDEMVKAILAAQAVKKG